MSHSSNDGGTPGGEGKPVPPFQAALADAARAFSTDPAGAARRLFDTAERALGGIGRANGGGRDPVAGLATAASRFLSELQAQQPNRAAGTPAGSPPGSEDAPAGPLAGARQDGEARAAPTDVPAAPGPAAFVELPQPGEGWSFHVRAEAVEAVAPAGEAGCALHLSDGSTVQAGQSSDAAAARLPPGLARLSQVGTQCGLYVRPEAVLVVAAPAGGGSVLRLRGERELAAAEAAAVAAGLLAGREG